MRELISTSRRKKKEKKRMRGMKGQTFSPNPRKRGKSHLYYQVGGFVQDPPVFHNVAMLQFAKKRGGHSSSLKKKKMVLFFVFLRGIPIVTF